MKKSRVKTAIFMLAMGLLVPVATMDSEAAEAESSNAEMIMEVQAAEESETKETVSNASIAESEEAYALANTMESEEALETAEEMVAETIQTKRGWVKEEDGYRYYVDGSYLYSQKMKINGKWYFFKADGIMAEREMVAYQDSDGVSHRYYAGKTGALLVNQWYFNSARSFYFGETGEGVNGVVALNDTKYYFSNGVMIKGTNIVADQKCYVVNEKGIVFEAKNNAWTRVDGKYYYVKDYKFLCSTVEKIGSEFYGFDYMGRMYDDEAFEYGDGGYYRAKKGGQLYRGEWYGNYYYNSTNGAAPTGFCKVGKVYYYFRKGMAVTDEYVENSGTLYHADSSGALTKITDNGFFYEDANRLKFVYVENGRLVYGWRKINGHYYYFKPYACRAEIEKINGKWYCFNQDGILETDGWLKLHGGYSTFYAAASGELLTGDQKINGKWYHFSEGGGMDTGIVKTETGFYIYGEDGVYEGRVRKGWNKVSDNWYYFDGESLVTEKLMTIGKYTYFFDQQGKMVADDIVWVSAYDPDTGRRSSIGRKLFDSDGHLVKAGWYGLYYVDPATGNPVIDTEKEINGKIYFFKTNGMCITKDYLNIQNPTLIRINASNEHIEKSPQLIQVASTGEVISKKDMPDGWKLFDGTWYYYRNGMPVNGWVGKYYVKAGAMLRSTSPPDGYWVGQDGAYQKTAGWVRVNKEQENGMYVKAGGRLAENEWLKLEGKWYYFNNYSCVTGAKRINGTWYIFGDDGALQSTLGKLLKNGWKMSGNDWYYFKGGALVNGSLSIGGKEYTFEDSRMIGGPGFENVWYGKYGSNEDGCYYNNVNGQAQNFVGWKRIDGKWYCFGENSKAYMNSWYSWYRVNGKLYYQREDGIVTGVQLINWRLYQFDKTGALIKLLTYDDGWHKLEGKWYYFRGGRPVTSDIITTGGKTYLLGEDGALACNELVGGDPRFGLKRYYADENGVIVRDQLVMIDGHPHYFGSDGRELYGVWIINGKTYYLDY